MNKVSKLINSKYYLIAIITFFFLSSYNECELKPELWYFTVIYLVISFSIIFLINYLKSNRAVFLASLGLYIVLFFSKIHVLSVGGFGLLGIYIRVRIILGVIILLYLLIVLLTKKIEIQKIVHSFIFTLFSIFIVLELLDLFSTLVVEKKDKLNGYSTVLKTSEYKFNENDRPNIYFILLDAYSSNFALKTCWGYKNDFFSNSLKLRGFKIANNGKGAYRSTIRSVASMFSMNYLPVELNELPENVYKSERLSEKIKNSLFGKILSENNYKFVNLSIFNFEFNGRSKIYEEYYKQTFTYHIYNKTLIRYLLQPILEYYFIDREILIKHNQLFQSTINIAKEKTIHSKFVYSHFLLPHEPFIIDSNGILHNKIYPFNDKPEDYLNQLKFASNFSLQLIDSIQKIDPSCMIILTGDHGYRYFQNTLKDKVSTYSAFTAIYLPTDKRVSFSNSIASPNIFRTVLRDFFEVNIELLPDTSNYYIK